MSDNIGRFPDHMAPKSEKDNILFGLKVGTAILENTKEYRETRNKIISRNRRFAEGKQPVQPYLDQMNVDGKVLFTNIRFKPRPVARKFMKIVVDGYLLREEFAKATALSKHIKDRKERKKSDAKFRMQFGQDIEEMAAEAGVPIEDPNAFTPEDIEELDLYSELNDKEREELLMQEMISFTLNDNNIKAKKRKFLSDIFVTSLSGYYNYLDKNGRLVVDYIQPEDAVYANSTEDEISHKNNYNGRLMKMTISEARSRFKLTPKDEKALFANARKYSGKYGNPTGMINWQDDYRFSGERPYDGYTIDIFHFWWRCNKVINYVEGKDNFGRDIFDVTYAPLDFENKKEGKVVGTVSPQIAYEGYMLMDKPWMLEWGEHRNILRIGQDKEEVLSPFIYHMPDNDGRMMTPSTIDMMIDNLESMDIIILKIKLIVAQAAPDGYIIDVNSLADLDLGSGIGEADPMTIDSLYRQTGNIYYKSMQDDGLGENKVPVQTQLSGFSSKLGSLVELYNTEMSSLRELIGVNEFRDGTATSPRTGFRFAQAQLDSSNTATWSIYNSYLLATKELVRQIGIRIWDSLAYGTPNKGYLQFMGKHNADLIKERKDLTASSYDYKFEITMQQEEKDKLEENITTCLSQGTLEVTDAILIREVSDIRLALRMLKYLYEKRRKQRMEEAQANQKSAADYSAQAGVAVEQAKGQTLKMELQMKEAVVKMTGESDRDTQLEKLVFTMIEKAQEGIPIPKEFEGLVNLVMKNRGINVEAEVTQKSNEIQQMQESDAQNGTPVENQQI